MARRPKYNTPQKNRMIGRVQEGQSIPKAAEKENIKEQAARDIYKKFLETGSTHTVPQARNPRTLTHHMKHAIKAYAKKHRRATPFEVGKAMNPQISEASVCNCLDKFNLHQRKARKAHKASQRLWGNEFKGFTEEDWAHIIWSDEC